GQQLVGVPVVERALRVRVVDAQPPHDLRRPLPLRRHALAPAPRGRNTRRRTPGDLPVPSVVHPSRLHDVFRFRKYSRTASRSQALTTSAAVSHPFRATITPQRTSSSPSTECASGLIAVRIPFSFARRQYRQSMSRRCGFALISIPTPRSAAASTTASRSIRYPPRPRSSRPVG